MEIEESSLILVPQERALFPDRIFMLVPITSVIPRRSITNTKKVRSMAFNSSIRCTYICVCIYLRRYHSSAPRARKCQNWPERRNLFAHP